MTLELPRRKAIKAGIDLPALGLGTYQSFDTDDLELLANVLAAAREAGSELVDTAPVYNRSEASLAALVAGDENIFVATKVWKTDPAEAEIVLDEQLRAYERSTIDLLQVHNLNGWQANLPWLDAQKEAGRIRFTGVTYQFDNAFGIGGSRAELASIVEHDLVDFVQINLNAAEPDLAEDILPAAAEQGIGVLVMRPFGQGDLLAAPPPHEWLREVGCTTWSEALVRWVLSFSDVTSVLTATADPSHFRANAAAAAAGPLGPDEASTVAQWARKARAR